MTKQYLWLVIDHTPDKDIRRGPELVACTALIRPNDIVNVPDAYAENRYIGEYDGGAIYPWMLTDLQIHDAFEQPSYEEIFEERERESRRMRGA